MSNQRNRPSAIGSYLEMNPRWRTMRQGGRKLRNVAVEYFDVLNNNFNMLHNYSLFLYSVIFEYFGILQNDKKCNLLIFINFKLTN